MTFGKSLAVFVSLMIAVSARRMVVHESLAAAPGSFVNQGAAHVTDMLTLRFALAPNNIAGLQAKMMSISTPGSSEHRQWLSAAEVLDLLAFLRKRADQVPQGEKLHQAFSSRDFCI